MNRRTFLGACAGAAVERVGLLSLPASAEGETLKQLAADKGFLFGSSLAMKYFDQMPAYRELVVAQCSIVTPEIHMKWNSLSSQRGVYAFSNADKLVGFCASQGIKVRGHTLVWHDSLPGWIASTMTNENGLAIMQEHIHTVASHFAGRLYSWDVVNEVLDPASGRSDGLRNSVWLKAVGDDYIEKAFRACAAADPKALLIWNENYLEVSNGYGDAKRKAMLSLLDRMLHKGVPIHGIGIESHLRGEQAQSLGDRSYEGFLDEVARRGMKIFITELDVQDATYPADVASRDSMVADLYRRYLEATLRQKAVRGIVTWGLSDRFSWIGGYRPRADQNAVRPLPFDADLKPKPAYYAIADALRSAPSRVAT